MRKKTNWWVRPGVQILFFLLVALISINHSFVASDASISWLASASLHALCPFGGVVSLYQLATVGTFVQKIHQSSFVLMVIALLLAMLMGPVFCGWLCPFGTVQEWFSQLGKRLWGRRHNHLVPP